MRWAPWPRAVGWMGLVLAAMAGAMAQPVQAGDCPDGYIWDHTITREVVGDTIVEHKGCKWLGPALRQAEIAAADANSAACEFDGRKLDCGKPVTMVTVAASPLAVPADAAAYINGIDPKYADNPTVKSEIELYARMAGVRGRAKNTLVADSGAYNTRPSQDNKYRVDADKKQLNVAASDEAAIKTKLGGMIKNIDAGHPANYKPEPVVPMPGSR